MKDARRVIVVDDEAAILEAVGRMLVEDGFEAELFHSPSEAIEACCERPPAFVLTDFLMAEMSGEELAEILRAELGARCPRIVCVTGWLAELRADQIAVFDRVIEKPFAYCDLVRAFDELESQPRGPGAAPRPWSDEPAP